MAWANMLDAGPCTVSCRHFGTVYWSGPIAKGESSPAFTGYYGDNTEMLQISVDANGVASLSRVSGANHADGYELVVTPTYDVTGRGLRASGIGIASDAPYAAEVVNGAGGSIALTPAAGWQYWLPTTVTPDPAEIPTGVGVDPVEIGMSMGAAS